MFGWNDYNMVTPTTQNGSKPASVNKVAVSHQNVEPRLPARGHSLLAVLREAYNSEAMTPVLPYDPNALLSKRRVDAMTPARISEIRRLTAMWHCVSDLSPAELEIKAEEIPFLATLLFVGTGKRGRRPRLDFFLMHLLTSSLFVVPLIGTLKEGRSRARLLGAFLPTMLSILLTRGLPRIDAGLLMSYTDVPLPPSQRPGKTGKQLPGVIGLAGAIDYVNPWPCLLQHGLPAHDSHTVKALRALCIAAQRYGTVAPGEMIGAFDEHGQETLEGTSTVDGTVFVRAAGVLLDIMGWVVDGEPEGSWDRSALGWDEAWENDNPNNTPSL